MKNERLKPIFCLNSNPPGPLVPMANVQSNPDAIQLHLGANNRYLVVPSNEQIFCACAKKQPKRKSDLQHAINLS